MKIKALLFVFFVIILGSCRSEFEKVRTSNDPQLMYQKAKEYYEKEEYQRALALIEIVLNSYRGRAEFEDINFMLADTYYKLGDYELASSYFKNFANGFYNSPKREEADFLSAYSLYLLSPSYRLDQTNTLKAINSLQLFINTYPTSNRVEQCNNLISELRGKLEHKAYDSAMLYYNIRNYESAIHSFENMLKDFPDTDRAAEIRYLIIKASYEYAENSIFVRQIERYEGVITEAEDFLTRFSQSSFKREVREILNNSRNKLKSFKDDRYKIQSSRNGG